MDSLEKEILKYEKKGFKIESKQTLKNGSRIFLKKKTGILSSMMVYLNYVDGNATTDCFYEFFRNYERLHKEGNWSKGDMGIFLCSGVCDEKVFKELRKAMIKDDRIRNSIKLRSLGKTTEEEEVEEETEIEAPRRKVTEEGEIETPNLTNLIEKIKKFSPLRVPNKEKQLEDMLLSYLSHSYTIHPQQTYERATIDARIGNIGIEIKFRPSATDFDRLFGQIDKYRRYLEKIIIVIGYEKSREYTESFQQRIKERGWLNSKVFVVSLR
jgi:hypothetical protein